MSTILPILMFVALFSLVFLGIPVSLSLLVVAGIFGYVAQGENVGVQLYGGLLSVASNFPLIAVSLFIFMGAVLERSQIAKNLLYALRLVLGRFPGGLSLSVILICAIFAASSGIVGAVEVLVGLMSVPTMLAAGYKKDLIAGSICGGGSLGTIIPPSVVVIIYASLADLSIGDLFAGILIPGLVMTALFIAYVIVRCTIRPEDGPALPEAELRAFSPMAKLRYLLIALLPCVVLILCVLGSIFAGVASPTEAAGVGAFGAVALAVAYRQFSLRLLVDALKETANITAMTMMIVTGGTLFTSAFLLNGGGFLIRSSISGLEMGPAATMFLFFGILFLLGLILDWISILLITIPLFNPVVIGMGIDPIWFAVMVCVVLQTSYLTPPMAPSIFYLQSIASKHIPLGAMYRGVVPFIALQLVTLALVYVFPKLATYMPSVLFRL